VADLSDDERSQAFLQRVHAEMQLRVSASTVPILIENGPAPLQSGTGTLFQVAGAKFIVTARHVLDEAQNDSRSLWSFDPTSAGPFMQLRGDWAGFGEPCDVVILKLHDTSIERFALKHFLTLGEVDSSHSPNDSSAYFLYGFPLEWTSANTKTKTVGGKPLSFLVNCYDGDTETLRGFDPRVHFALAFSRRDVVDLDGLDGADLPRYYGGISGAGVWKVWGRGQHGPDIRGWTSARAKLVAVQTGVYGDSVAKATRWDFVRQLLERYYPTLLRAAESVHRPDRLRLVAPTSWLPKT
jgi:hypothetical protein